MKGNTTTIRKIIAGFQPVRKTISHDIPEDLDMLPEEKKRYLLTRGYFIGEINISISVNKSRNKLFINYNTKRLARSGGRVFFKRSTHNIVYMENNSVKIKDENFLRCYCNDIYAMMGVCWIKDLDARIKNFLSKSVIFKAILTGRVYNEETLIKRIASACHGVKNSEWKEVRGLLTQTDMYFSLVDLNCFTKNLNNSVRIINRLISDRDKKEHLQLIVDTLENAIVLGRKIDLNWSKRRMEEEHQEMLREISLLDSDEKSDHPLYDEVIIEDNIRMLNSEKEVFLEGITMSHCVYTNYFNDIRNGKYLVCHMHSPEECTIGIGIDKEGNPYLDQAQRYKNRPIQQITRMVIKSFLEKHNQKIKNLAHDRMLANPIETESTFLPF